MDDKRMLDRMVGDLVFLTVDELVSLQEQLAKELKYRQMSHELRPATPHEVSRGAW